MDKILDAADPYIADFLFSSLMLYFGGALRLIFRNKAAQDSLHRALETGVDYVTDQLAQQLVSLADGKKFSITPAMTETVASYVHTSVPDSVRHLKASRTMIETMAKAKLAARASKMLLRAH